MRINIPLTQTILITLSLVHSLLITCNHEFMDRRTSLKLMLGSAALCSMGHTPWLLNTVIRRTIHSSGEKLPLVGLGTWRTFDKSPQHFDALTEVLRNLKDQGGLVIDSSPMYGRSEQVVGSLSQNLGANDHYFMASKVWTSGYQAGIDQMNRSMNLMQKRPLDLMQVHNLVDWKTHLNTLFKWKSQGKIRYVGITHYLESAYNQMESIMKHYPLDFIQVNLSLGARNAQNRLLPLAAD